MKSMLFFDLIDLFAECRLGDVQAVGSPREVQLLSQTNDRVKVTYFNPGEHCSNPLWQMAEIGNRPTSSIGTSKREKAAIEISG
jgi:hypothetical protein